MESLTIYLHNPIVQAAIAIGVIAITALFLHSLSQGSDKRKSGGSGKAGNSNTQSNAGSSQQKKSGTNAGKSYAQAAATTATTSTTTVTSASQAKSAAAAAVAAKPAAAPAPAAASNTNAGRTTPVKPATPTPKASGNAGAPKPSNRRAGETDDLYLYGNRFGGITPPPAATGVAGGLVSPTTGVAGIAASASSASSSSNAAGSKGAKKPQASGKPSNTSGRTTPGYTSASGASDNDGWQTVGAARRRGPRATDGGATSADE